MEFAFDINPKDLKRVDDTLMVKRDVNVVKFTLNGMDCGAIVAIIN